MSTKTLGDAFTRITVFVIGDVMLDEYLTGSVERISPEAPVPVLKVEGEVLRLGGAANVALNLHTLGAGVRLFGTVGDDPEGSALLKLLEGRGIGNAGIVKDNTKPTTKKSRLVAGNQQMLRVDREVPAECSPVVHSELLVRLAASIDEHPPEAIILSDYAKGLLSDELAAEIIKLGGEKGIFIAVDPKGRDFTKYRGTSLITPNRKEVETATGIAITSGESLGRAFEAIFSCTGAETVVITRGREGMSYCVKGGDPATISPVAREVYDVTGAGDTVVSTLVLGLVASMGIEDSVRLANAAAGVVITQLGTASVTPIELEEAASQALAGTSGKIVPRDLLVPIIAGHRTGGSSVVFTNGCFDLFHFGHLSLILQASKLGDILVVALNTDESVRRLKGPGRPLINEGDRARLVAALEDVDYVTFFDEDTPLELIQSLMPDIVVKGGDYSPEEVVGGKFVEGYGGRVEIVPVVDGISTSGLIERIRSEGD